MLHSRLSRPRGQALPLVVLMLTVIFLIIGLGIDGGLLYAQRRLMQNTADAACLAAANQLALGRDSATAQASAVTVIQQNLGPSGAGTGANAPGTLSYANIADVYAPNAGAGTGLTRGIELSGPQVRVALTSPAFTYFMRLMAQPSYTVAARARCDATAGAGGSPFAVARWQGFDDKGNQMSSGLSTDIALAAQVGGSKGADEVRDVLARSTAAPLATKSSPGSWPGWNTADYPGSPDTGTGLYSQPAQPASAPPSAQWSQYATHANPGVEIQLAGQGAASNGGNGFTGPVLLDIRNITSPGAGFYNDIDPTRASSTNKDFITRNILKGYFGPPIPPGTQIAFTPGVSAGQVQKPFEMRYNPGDVVSVLMFNGTVYSDADFTTSFPSAADSEEARTHSLFSEPNFPSDCDLRPYDQAYMHSGSYGDPAATLSPWAPYKLTVEPFRNRIGNKQDPYSANFALRAFSSVPAGSFNDPEVRWNSSSWGPITAAGYPQSPAILGAGTSPRTFDVQIRQSALAPSKCETYDLSVTPPLTYTIAMPAKPVVGAYSFYLEAKDKGTALRRGQYVFMSLNAKSSDFYFYAPGLVSYTPIELGNKTETRSQEFVIRTVGGTNLKVGSGGVSTGAITWFSVDEASEAISQLSSAPGGIDAQFRARNGSNFLDVDVTTAAEEGKSYYLRIPVTYNGATRWAWYYLAIMQDTSNSNTLDQYVYTLGYANFVITEIKSNEIYGRAISGLLKPGDVLTGMQPRLVPWE
jgi:hypothetical protein